MDQRQPELHVSALSPPEFRAYTRYLDLLALQQARTGDGGLGVDGSVRFDRAVLRDFASERLGVTRLIVDDVLTCVAPVSAPGGSRLAVGQVYAVLRMLAHAGTVPKSPRRPSLDTELLFIPADPLPLDPEPAGPPPAPPRRVASISSRPSSGATRDGRPEIPPKRPSLPPRPSSPTSPRSPPAIPSKPSGTPGKLTARKSLPAGHSLDPFRDTPSPSSGSLKTRTYSHSGVGSNNPFRSAGSSPTPLLTVDPVEVLDGGRPTASSAPPSAGIRSSVGPPLPPRKPSIKRPNLPPRVPTSHRPPTIESTSSSASWSEGSRVPQPTSQNTPSELMQQSLAAAAAGASLRKPKDEVVLQVIKSTNAPGEKPPRPPPLAPPQGRRDIIDTVTRAVRESEEGPPPPPLRRVSSTHRPGASKPATPVPPVPAPPSSAGRSPSFATTSTHSGVAGPFNSVAEQYRARYPGLRTWSNVNLFADRPVRSPHAMIILNQPVTRKDTLLRTWSASALRFCADGGANRLYDALDAEERAQFLPTMIKGDLDSIRSDVKSYYSNKGVSIKRDQDEYSTDLMKCMQELEAIEKASGKRFSVVLYGGLSGRLDQTIHTLSFLYKLREKRKETFVLSEDSLAWVLDAGHHLIDIDHMSMGQTCGILPVGVSEAYVRTEGLKWNLDWMTSLGGELSTSNHLLPSEPAVFLETSEPVYWTVEIRPGLPLPSMRSSPADELSRGVKELAAGFGRAAQGAQSVFGRRMSSRSAGSGPSVNGDERLGLVGAERDDRAEAALARRRDDGDMDGYAQLD